MGASVIVGGGVAVDVGNGVLEGIGVTEGVAVSVFTSVKLHPVKIEMLIRTKNCEDFLIIFAAIPDSLPAFLLFQPPSIVSGFYFEDECTSVIGITRFLREP